MGTIHDYDPDRQVEYVSDIPITRAMIRLVECPKCGAKPGEMCVGRTVRSHMPRLQYAQRVGGEALLAMEQERG